jgi:hypothetical protein
MLALIQNLVYTSLSSPFATVLIWLFIVALALGAIDWLFPRIHRISDDRSEQDGQASN